MVVKTNNRTFVYGHFRREPIAEMLAPFPDIAIEILREYSADEFVGKLYHKGISGDWAPMTPSGVSNYDWYKHPREKGPLRFEMDGSGTWEVLYFRTESDESGPYMAIALKYAPAKPSK